LGDTECALSEEEALKGGFEDTFCKDNAQLTTHNSQLTTFSLMQPDDE
jgi:hypothetical protein